MKKRNKRYYGRIDFKGRKFKSGPHRIQPFGAPRTGEGVEFSGRIGNDPYTDPVEVEFNDIFTSHWTYADSQGTERVLRITMEFVTPEQRDTYVAPIKAVHGEGID